MKRFLLVFLLSLFMLSCHTQRQVTSNRSSEDNTTVNSNLKSNNKKYDGANAKLVNQILTSAEKYLGTPYQYAGNSENGLDCSGLVCKVFAEHERPLPRRSADQALQGQKVSNEAIRPGDLLFFATSGGTKVSHVGIVHDIKENGEITFIHSSSSKGVIISSLNDKYWSKTYLFARRVL